jgi:hypothetical protein
LAPKYAPPYPLRKLPKLLSRKYARDQFINVEINPEVPRIHGHSFIHINAIDYAVDVEGTKRVIIIMQEIR